MKRILALVMLLTVLLGCMVTSASAAVAVKSVKLDKTSINMLGKAVTLKATCQPSGSNQKVTWTSSNSKVATVSSSGVVTPKGYGSCTITAKSNNGKTATCSVYVKKDNTISKSKVVSSGNPGIGKYTLTDTFTIVVDGLTGKIKAHDCYQTVTKTGMLAVVSVSNNMKVYNVTDKYIDVRSQYKLSYKGAIGTVTKLFGGDMSYVSAVFTRTYRIDNQGNVTITSYSEQR